MIKATILRNRDEVEPDGQVPSCSVKSRPRVTGLAACVALVAASAVGHAVGAWGVAAGWIASDEPTYGMLGRSLWHDGTLTVVGAKGPFYGIVYPALAGLPLTVFGLWNGIRALQLVQPLVMSSAGLIVFFWARRLVSARLAVLAAALTLCVPALVYSGLIMTEVAFYPLATLALLALSRSIEEPTLERQAVAVAAVLLASLTRLQGLVLLPVLVTAIATVAVFERSGRLFRRFALTLVLLTVAGALVLGFHATGTSRDMLGAYSTTTHASYAVGPALRWVVWHAGGVFLLVGGVPLLATVILVIDAVRGREREPAVQALLALTVSYVAWSVIQVGVFSSRFSGVLLERNLITLAPPLFLVFSVWLARGLPRPQPLTTVACAVFVAPALALPVTRLTDPAAAPQAFTALALTHLRDWTSVGWTRVAWIVGVMVVTALFLAVPRRVGWILPAVVLLLLSGATAVASADVKRLSSELRRNLFGANDPRWVDRAAEGPVTYVYDGTPYWNGVWIQAFWNSRINRLAVLPGPVPGPLPPHLTVSPRFDGRLFTSNGRALDDPYVLASQRMTFTGTAVTSITQPIDGGTLTLWKIDPPLRLRVLRTGFQPNGDVYGHAQIDVFDCGPGSLQVTVLGKDGSPVTLSAPGVKSQTVAPGAGIGAPVVVRSPASQGLSTRCTFALDTPGLAGTTVISFVPATG